MAAAATVRTFIVKPGRMEEFRAALAEMHKLTEAAGAKTRVWATVYAGEASGRVISVSEYEDNAAMGAALDQLLAQWPLPLQKVLEGDNPAAVSLSLSTLVEIT